MQCREFREISESYLSDELLVETNIQVFRHLENCPNCRREFAAKRELREKMRNIGRHGDEFQIDPMFATRLQANLEDSALNKGGGIKSWLTPKFLIPVMASLLMVATLGLVLFNWSGKNGGVTISQNAVTKALAQISLLAVGNHKDCALEKLQMWESMSKQDYAEKAAYNEKVVKPLQAKFAENVEMLHAHDCIFEGKEFSHVILRKGGHIISVFVDKSDVLPDDNSSSTIISEQENGLQVASFEKSMKAVFVISDMSESDNLSAARVLSDSFIAQNSI